MKSLLTSAAVALVLGLSGNAFAAGNQPSCSGSVDLPNGTYTFTDTTPGGAISGGVQFLNGSGTPPGSVASGAAQSPPFGAPNLGTAVSTALRLLCGLPS
jgi:hypothetical protein